MKLLTTLLIAAAVGLGVYALRRRLKLALTVAAAVYFVVLPVRLLFSAGDLADRVDQLAWPALALFVVWVALWFISTRYERGKRARSPSPPRPRGR